MVIVAYKITLSSAFVKGRISPDRPTYRTGLPDKGMSESFKNGPRIFVDKGSLFIYLG
jgi:hypothetical protein